MPTGTYPEILRGICYTQSGNVKKFESRLWSGVEDTGRMLTIGNNNFNENPDVGEYDVYAIDSNGGTCYTYYGGVPLFFEINPRASTVTTFHFGVAIHHSTINDPNEFLSISWIIPEVGLGLPCDINFTIKLTSRLHTITKLIKLSAGDMTGQYIANSKRKLGYSRKKNLSNTISNNRYSKIYV